MFFHLVKRKSFKYEDVDSTTYPNDAEFNAMTELDILKG